jgi:ketosteroid isomerase-like protein
MSALMLAVALAVQYASPAASPAPTTAPAPQARPEIAAEVQRGLAAYNVQDIAYYQASLAPDAVYIADDGAVFAGKERIVGLFTRIFARTPKPRLEATDIVTGGRGDVAWARFKWTLSEIEKARSGVAIAIFVRGNAGWQVASIQNTPVGHAMRMASPAPAASPSPAPHQH